MSSIESKEFVRMRADQFAMAAHEAMRSRPPGVYDDMTRAEARAEAAEETRRKKCLCCAEWRQIRVMMHVCEECFEELEDER